METTLSRNQILFVDDEASVLNGLKRCLRNERDRWDLHFARSGAEALACADATPLDLVVTDAKMPGMAGSELLRALNARADTRDVPTIMLTGCHETELRREALEAGVIEFLQKPIEPQELVVRIENVIRLKSIGDDLRRANEALAARNRELAETRLQVIRRLGKAAEYRDNETGRHVVRVGHYSRLLAQALGLDDEHVELIAHAAPMHDIGKIGIPDSILLKPGSLDFHEWEIMRKHCPLGEDVLRPLTPDEMREYRLHPEIGEAIFGEPDTPLLRMAGRIAAGHHERWDGSGYPQGLRGEDIPLEARIVAVADVYDALSSARPYKPAFPEEKCDAILREMSGTHLDPRLVDLFFAHRDRFREIRTRFTDEPQPPREATL